MFIRVAKNVYNWYYEAMKGIIFVLLASVWAIPALSVSLGMYVDGVITSGMKPDRAWGSMLLMAMVHQQKFGSNIEIFVGNNGTCFDLECIKSAVKGAVNVALDWKKVQVKRANRNLDKNLRFDAWFSSGKENIPTIIGQGTIMNVYFFSHEHLKGSKLGRSIRENHSSLRHMSSKEWKEEVDRFASYDLIFIPSSAVHDVFLTATHHIYALCHKLISVCPSVATHHIAGHMYADQTRDVRTNGKARERFSQDLTTIAWRAMQMGPFKETVKRLYPRYRKYPWGGLADAKQCDLDCEGSCICKYVALIVEPSINAYFEFAVRTIVRQLTSNSKLKWNLHVMHSEANAHFVRTVLQDLDRAGKVQFSSIPVNVHVVGDYNQLTKKAVFWEHYSLPGAKVLLFQSDTVMLGNATSIDDFMDLDYVGAPWHNEWNDNLNAARALPGGHFKEGVGNGGFSLRSGEIMYYIASHFEAASSSHEQEDMFFVKHMEILQRARDTNSTGNLTVPAPAPQAFRVASRRRAWQFAYEVKCEDVAATMNPGSSDWRPPLALHAAWYYWQPTEMKHFLEYL